MGSKQIYTMYLNTSFLKTIYYLSYKDHSHGIYSRHWEIVLSNVDMGDVHILSGLLFMYVLSQPLMAFGFIEVC